MKIRLLVMHRKENYFGEHPIEVLAVVDELTMEESPGWWVDAKARQKNIVGDDANRWAEVQVELDHDALWNALYPRPVVLNATVTMP